MRTMEVPKLNTLAFVANIQHLWKTSDMPSILANLIYQKKISNDVFEDTNDKINIALQNILEGKLAKVPFHMKYALIAGVSGLNSDIGLFADELTLGRRKSWKSKRSIRFCLDNIFLNTTGGFHFRQSVLNIMVKSNFDIDFKILFLAKHCVRGIILRKVMSKYIKSEQVDVKNPRDRACKRKPISNTKTMTKYMARLCVGLKGEYFWSLLKRDANYHDMSMQHVTSFQFVAAHGHEHVLEYFYWKLARRIDRKELQSDTLDAAKYMLLNNCFDVGKLMFFHRHLRRKSWLKLLRSHAGAIVEYLLFSWRYRHHVPAFFRDCLAQFTVQKCTHLFVKILGYCREESFHYYDVMSVLQWMWLDMPKELTEDYQMSQVLIPRILTLNSDVESLVHFISSYDVELQKNVVAQYIFNLISAGKENSIDDCLKTLKSQRCMAIDLRELLTIDRFKFFLVYVDNFDSLDMVSKVMCDTDAKKTLLKNNLLNDKEFLTELLVNARAEKDVIIYFNWLLECEKMSRKFRESLLYGGILSDVYDRRIIESDTLKCADEIFRAFKCTPSETQYIADLVQDNELVLKMYVTSMMETHQFEKIEKIFTSLKDARAFMKTFLLSPEGKSRLLDTLINVPIVESCSSFKFKYSNFTMSLYRFCNDYIIPCRIQREIIAWIGSVKGFAKEHVRVGHVSIMAVTQDPQEITVAHGIAREQMANIRNYLSQPRRTYVRFFLNNMDEVFDLVGLFLF